MGRHQPSIDRLPELQQFADTGCNVHPSCLTCPLPQCRYDEPGGLQREEREGRNAEVLRMRKRQALSVDELAQTFGVSTRTVHRILREGSTRPGVSPRPMRIAS